MMGALTGGVPGIGNEFWYSGLFPGRQTSSGEVITESKALTLSTYYGCVKVLSEDVAKLPLLLLQETDGFSRDAVSRTHPVAGLLRHLNPIMTNQAVRETLTANCAGWGYGIAEIQRNESGRPVALWPIHSSRVVPRCVMGSTVWDICVDDCDAMGRQPGTTVRLLDDDVFHLRGFGSGRVGYSVLQYAAEAMGLGLAAQRFGASFFGNGAMPSIVITHPSRLKPDAAIALRESSMAANRGEGKTRRPVVIEEGATVAPLSINPDDGQFLETRQFQVEDVCRWFRMPPVKIQHNQNTPYSNIESLDQAYVKDTLWPWFNRWEEEGNRKLLLTRESELGYFLDHDVDEQLRQDAKTQSEVDKSDIASGKRSINEVRRRVRMPSIPGGDAHFMQQGFTTVESVANGENLKPQSVSAKPSASVLRPVVASLAARVLARECNALARASKKYNDNQALLSEWAEGFYSEHKLIMADSFAPVAESWLAMSGLDCGDHVTAVCSTYSFFPDETMTAEMLTDKIMMALESCDA